MWGENQEHNRNSENFKVGGFLLVMQGNGTDEKVK
jgi:hypothetical protein